MHAPRGRGVELLLSLDLGNRWSEWSALQRSHALAQERTLGTHWLGCWVGPRAGLNTRGYRKNPLKDNSKLQSVWKQGSQNYLDFKAITLKMENIT
jgi:hypothetical protein